MNRLHIAELHMQDHQLFLIQCMTASPRINSYHAGQQYITFLKCLFSCLDHNIRKWARQLIWKGGTISVIRLRPGVKGEPTLSAKTERSG